MIRRPPRSTLFPTRRSSDLLDRHCCPGGNGRQDAAARDRARRALSRAARGRGSRHPGRSEEHTSELQSRRDLVCRLLLEKKKIALAGASTDTKYAFMRAAV